MPHANGKIQPVLQFLRLQLKSALPLVPVLPAQGYPPCAWEGVVIPWGGLGLRFWWVLMLRTLKMWPLVPQNDEKSMSAPFLGVSKKGCRVTRQGHVPVHMGLIVTQGCSWEPAGPRRSFSSSFFAGVSPPSSEAPETDKSWKEEAGKDVGAGPPGGVKQSQDIVLDPTLGATLGTRSGIRDKSPPAETGRSRGALSFHLQ